MENSRPRPPQLKPISILGSGSFGYVFKAFDENTQSEVAVKRTLKAGKYVSREYEVLQMLKGCENCVELLDMFYTRTDTGTLVQNLVMEYIPMNLEKYIQDYRAKKKRIALSDIKRIMTHVMLGLEHIHSLGVTHRDLKPENILIDYEEDIVKICDFGSSKLLQPGVKNTPYIVSRFYRAPELILGATEYNSSIDIWAAGCILAELFIKDPCFPGQTEGSQIIEQIAVLGAPTIQKINKMNKNCSKETITMIRKLGSIEKVGLKQLIPLYYEDHEVELLVDLLEQMFDWNPSKRLTASEVLEHPFFKDGGVTKKKDPNEDFVEESEVEEEVSEEYEDEEFSGSEELNSDEDYSDN